MNFVWMLISIEECLITPHLAFAQIFLLLGYKQYGIHGNVPTNLNLVQNVLLCMP
jgi:hypothetical protein